MKAALIHDWLTGMRGGEKVLEALCDCFPGAPIYTLLHIPGAVSQKIESHPIRTSFIQHIPGIRKHYRNYLPLFPAAVERFDVREFDLIVSSSHCVAKGVVPSPSAMHLCYCHTPVRYLWSHYQDYFGHNRIGLLKRLAVPILLDHLRSWDVSSNARVHSFACNSNAVAARIRKFYGREASVIHPPVDVEFFCPSEEPRQDFLLIVSALVPYKRIELALEAAAGGNRKLLIVGTGPEEKYLRSIAPSNVEFLGRVTQDDLRHLYRTAAALLQPGEEDFGINIVEAQACECPVIAYRAGGALETVIDEETGLFFNELTASALNGAVDKMGSLVFNKGLMRRNVLRFSLERFKAEFQAFVEEKLQSE
jgi:glycosyltransferase involved in cell wall biosynthesis